MFNNYIFLAFHEAIGEAIGLSVSTPRHLQALGLVQASVEDTSVDINFLYSMALEKVVFLPFAYVMDKWRYDVFRGDIGKDQYNCHWWRLRFVTFKIYTPFCVTIFSCF